MPKKETKLSSKNNENNVYDLIEHLVEDWLPDNFKKFFKKYFTLPVLGGICCGLLSFSVSYAILPSIFVGLVGSISTHITFLILKELSTIMLQVYESLKRISKIIEHIEKTADKLNHTVLNEKNLNKLNQAIDNFVQCSEEAKNGLVDARSILSNVQEMSKEAKQGLVDARSILNDVQAVSNPAGNVVRAATHQTQRVKNAVSGGFQVAGDVCKKTWSLVSYPFSSREVPPVEGDDEAQPIAKKSAAEQPPLLTYAKYKQDSEKFRQKETVSPRQNDSDSETENDVVTFTPRHHYGSK